MAAASYPVDRLVDYIFIVGPSTRRADSPLSPGGDIPSLIPTTPPPSSPPGGDWQTIHRTRPDVLWRYPAEDIPDRPLLSNITCFCQPELSETPLDGNRTHYFTLTNTETNVRTYSTCISFPYLTDSLLRAQSPQWQFETETNDSTLAIQEWGLLSVCTLSTRDNFRFFEQVITTFIHFIDHFCGDSLTWDRLIHSQYVPSTDTDYSIVWDVIKWLESLLHLPIPQYGLEVMEVELEVDPALVVGFPPSSRFPLIDLSIHDVLRKLDVHLVIEIYKLLLLEHKVIIHSQDFAFASQCVLVILNLLYPLQYLFPVIPLLPTCLPNAENLLLVPTPFFIGVPSSFVKKINSMHRMETWVIDLDNKKLESPIQQDFELLEKFPLTLHQLQADIKQALDKMEDMEKHTTNTSDLMRLKDETDVLIRIAFVEFLMGPELLGCIDGHLTIYRLFPRPVVDLRLASFLAAYTKATQNTDTEFISHFVKSQSVEYFMEWILNPSNKAFEEIRKGFCELERIGDKLYWWIDKLSPNHIQYTLYSSDPDSILYQEMLNHKAQQIPDTRGLSNSLSSLSSNSDFEEVDDGKLNYPEGSGISSYYSDDGSASSSSPSIAPEIANVAIDIHPSITVTKSTPVPPISANETFLSLVDTPSFCEHVPLPPEKDDSFGEFLPSNAVSTDTASSILTDALSSVPIDAVSSLLTDILPNDTVLSSDAGVSNSVSTDPISLPSLLTDPISPLPADFISDSALVLSPLADPQSLIPDPVSFLTDLVSNETGTNARVEESATAHNSTHDIRSSSPAEVSSTELVNNSPDSNIDLTDYNTPSPSSNKSSLHVLSDQSLNIPRVYSPSTDSSVSLPRVGSWMNLRGPLVEVMEFGERSNVNEAPKRDNTDKSTLSSNTVVRSVPWSAVSSLHELETQIKDIVGRIGAGQGLPWPKSVALKSIAAQERSRVALLRLLELRLGIRHQTNLLLSSDGEIVPVIVTRPVYKGVFELFKYMIPPIEATLQADIDAPVFSFFLVLRLALCLSTTPTRRKQTKTPNESPSSSPSVAGFRVTSILAESLSMHRFDPIPSVPSIDTEVRHSAVDSVPLINRRVHVHEPTTQEGVEKDVRRDDLVYLHTDLLKWFSQAMMGIVVKRKFWNSLFSAVVQADRKYLGWNEKTSELYQRYKSLPVSTRQLFSYEEDTLLSIVLHNILVFLLMIGISPKETMDVCHRISARTRLATAEEKLLHVTMSELENADSNGVNIRNLAVLALYSERHPIVTYIVHHGISVTAPIFKLQITDEVCILRRFPDERITCRYWNDHISQIDIDANRLTISFRYKEEAGEYYHHFHSKQYNEIYQCLQTLVSNS